MTTKAGRRRKTKTKTKVKTKPKLVVEIKEVREIKPVNKISVFIAVYTGKAKNMRISGVGRIHPGREFEVSEKIANTLKFDENFEVRLSYKEVEV